MFFNLHFNSLPVGMRSFVITQRICADCMSVHKYTSKRNGRPNFSKCSVHVGCGRDSVLFWHAAE